MATRAKAIYRDNPLVPIDGQLLKALLGLRGISSRQFAALLGVVDDHKVVVSRIHFITSGRTKRCRRSLRAAMANRLRVRARWLGGERPELPGGGLLGTANRLVSPRAYFAQYALLAAVEDRLARDPEWPGDERTQLNRALLAFLNPRAWRAALLRWAPPRRGPEGDRLTSRRDVRPEEMERAVPALAEALGVILAPWLEGYPVAVDWSALAGLLPRWRGGQG